jgi:hypothetical protein
VTGFIRWVIFILIGYPFQIIFNLIYPIIHLVWRFREFSYLEPKDRIKPNYSCAEVLPEHSSIRDEYYRDSPDNHNALEHYGFFYADQARGRKGLEHLLDSDGAFLRRYRGGLAEGNNVSGDCVGVWCFAYTLLSKDFRPVLALKIAAKHYLKNLGTKSNMDTAKGWVSARCNNFGLNYCPDGWRGIGQPMAGPQFWLNSAVFALAARDLGWKWKVVFWTHFWMMGGPLWVFSPQLYSRKYSLAYSRDIVMKALFCHLDVFGAKWWVTYPMRFIHDFIGEGYPVLFEAMLGRGDEKDMPATLSGWHSQNLWGHSGCERGCIYIPKAVNYIRNRARELGLNDN